MAKHTRIELIEQLRDFAAELDSVPTRAEMNEEGPLSSTPFYTEFGSWNAALNAAGLEVNHVNDIGDEELLAELRRLKEALNRQPRFEDMAEQGVYSPHTYIRRWESWPRAKEAAGLKRETRTSRRVSKEELLDAILELADELGQTPTQEEMDDLGRYSRKPFYRVWDSWNEVVEDAGLEPNHVNGYKTEALIEELQWFADRLGYSPTMNQMRDKGAYSPKVYVRAFGSWIEAWEAAGLDHRTENLAGRISQKQLLDELKRVAQELGRPPTRIDMNERGGHSHEPFVQRFGSWSSALEAAGFQPYRSPEETKEPIYYGANWGEQREKALERDGYACVDCGLTDEDHRQKEDGGLHVHHIKKARTFKDITEANCLSNLVTVCRKCHSERERSK